MRASPFRPSLLHSRHYAAQRTIVLLIVASLAACSARKSAAGESQSSAVASGQSDESGSSDAGSGTGHLHVTGDLTVDHDFIVDACQVAPPGDGLLAGYHMNAKDGDSTIVLLSVVVKAYDKDGPYSPAYNTSAAQAGEVMNTGSMDFLSLQIARPSSPMPVAPMLKPESKLVVTISGNGLNGDAKFTDMESPVSFEDIDLNSKEKPHGKRVSGSITWSCGKIERVDAQMDAVVNGMMKKLMPAK
jgi:hypothetical protein